MKIEVDVIRIEQSIDLRTREAQSFFVLDLFGEEVRVACTEEQVAEAIASSSPAATSRAPAQFVTESAAEPPLPTPEPPVSAPARPAGEQRKLRPMTRPQEGLGDDVGIAQG
jgi:hypothetical protein